MKRVLITVAAVFSLLLAVASCTSVTSAAGGNTARTNDAWFTEITGLGSFIPFSSRVYYCPPTSGGAATCMEAEMIENANPGPQSGGTAAPAPAPAEDEGTMDEGEEEEEE